MNRVVQLPIISHCMAGLQEKDGSEMLPELLKWFLLGFCFSVFFSLLFSLTVYLTALLVWV